MLYTSALTTTATNKKQTVGAAKQPPLYFKEDIIMMAKIKFTKVIISESGFPQIELTTFVDGTEDVKRYLSPFRGYCFQVSMTTDGDCDCGTSVVIHLGSIINSSLSKRDCEEILKGLAFTAIIDYSKGPYASSNRDIDIKIPNPISISEESKFLEEFLEATYNWLKK